MTEVFQPPVVVSIQLLLSPVTQPGFPGTMGYGALAALFVCVLPLFLLLVLVRLGKVTDHHVSDRRQRAPVLLMALASILSGLLVLAAAGAPQSVMAMVLAVVADEQRTRVVVGPGEHDRLDRLADRAEARILDDADDRRRDHAAIILVVRNLDLLADRRLGRREAHPLRGQFVDDDVGPARDESPLRLRALATLLQELD